MRKNLSLTVFLFLLLALLLARVNVVEVYAEGESSIIQGYKNRIESLALEIDELVQAFNEERLIYVRRIKELERELEKKESPNIEIDYDFEDLDLEFDNQGNLIIGQVPLEEDDDSEKTNADNQGEQGVIQTENDFNQKAYYKDIFTSKKEEEVVDYALSKLSIPYVWGGNTDKGYDCSGFTKEVFRKMGISIPRVSRQQATVGVDIERGKWKTGDLVFFKSKKEDTTIGHVGIYLGKNKFVHASSGAGKIIVSDINSSWYKAVYVKAVRLLK